MKVADVDFSRRSPMPLPLKLFRLAALLLLLGAVVDIVGVDMLGAFWQDKATVQSELEGSCTQDDCFCCSSTVVPVNHIALAPTLVVTATDPVVTALVLFIPRDPLFQPPRT
jgi:hypothetical protein